MNWTALDRLGTLVRTEEPTYTPVYAHDPASNIGCLVYRGHHDDAVYARLTTGEEFPIGRACAGKWPLAVVVERPSVFRVAWIEPGLRTIWHARIETEPLARVTMISLDPLDPPSAILLELQPDGTIRTTGEGHGPRDVTRNGKTITLLSWQKENGRIVGADGTPNGPNRVLMADTDGWYVVVESNPSVQFPARLDVHGNVAYFEGGYVTNADIRTRPLVDTPPIVVPPVYIPPPIPSTDLPVQSNEDFQRGPGMGVPIALDLTPPVYIPPVVPPTRRQRILATLLKYWRLWIDKRS